MNSTEIGVMSEASKDSGDVGISAYLSAAPKLKDTRGMVGDFSFEEDGWTAALSTSALIAPFGRNDDAKRLNFSSIQNSHVIPIKNMRVPYVRTGYESIIPIRVGGKFVVIAERNGYVDKVTDSFIEVVYNDGGPTAKLVHKKYSIRKWTSKEESGVCYTHELVPNLVAGDKFIKDDTLLYDRLFFEPDIFNPKRVLYKQGGLVTVALMEDPQTYEDSAAIAKSMSDYLSTAVTKVKSNVVNNTDNITNLIAIGKSVTPNDVLFTVMDSVLGDVEDMDERTKSILQDFKGNSPKAKLKGVISKIVVYYNCELESMSKSLRAITEASDKRLLTDTGYTGKVSSSYSIGGKPLLPGSVEIKTYVDVIDTMGVGDKAILGNQLKFTVGEVFEYDMIAGDGTKLDVIFSTKSVKARVVNSPDLIGTTSMLLEKLTDKVVEMYFGKNS